MRRRHDGGRRPFRRQPKQLDAAPSLFEPAGGGRGAGLIVRGERGMSGHAKPPPGSSEPGVTDDAGELAPIDGESVVDTETLRIARRIAARLVIPRPRRDARARRGSGELTSVRYRGGSDEIDLDATLESLAEHPVPEEDDIVVRERVRTRRSIVLVVDVSGSMRGERVRTAAATVGALFGELTRDDVAVVAFWSDAALLVPLGQRPSVPDVLDRLLRIPARGLTNVSFSLEIAAAQLARVPPRDARVLLLSDCVHNAGPDPRDIAARLPRLDVLLDTTGEHDLELGRQLAAAGRGQLVAANRYQDVASGLSRIFAG